MKSRAVKGCFIALLVLCGIAAFVIWRVRTPPQVGESIAQLPPAERQRSREEARQLENQVSDVVESVQRKESKTFAIVATERQLNTLLQDRLRTEKFVVRDLRVGLEPNLLKLQGKVPYKGVDWVITLNGNVLMQHGKLAYQVESLQVGGWPAPSQWKESIERAVTPKLNELVNNPGGRVTRVTIEQGKLTIEGVTG